ncbi:hypothetical protein GJ496_003442 [Pomphorhynchus laevis]|nr:hypothetical protein GJ496_003442 [Pomphorhynchus laevis]
MRISNRSLQQVFKFNEIVNNTLIVYIGRCFDCISVKINRILTESFNSLRIIYIVLQFGLTSLLEPYSRNKMVSTYSYLIASMLITITTCRVIISEYILLNTNLFNLKVIIKLK